MKTIVVLAMMSLLWVGFGCSRTKPQLSVRQDPVVAQGFSEMDYRFVSERVMAAIQAKHWDRNFRLALGPVDTSGCRLAANGQRVHELVAMEITQAGRMQVSSRPWIDGQGYGQLAQHGQPIHGVLVGRVAALDTPTTHLSTGVVNEFVWRIVDPSNDNVMVVARIRMPDDRIAAEAAAAKASAAKSAE